MQKEEESIRPPFQNDELTKYLWIFLWHKFMNYWLILGQIKFALSFDLD